MRRFTVLTISCVLLLSTMAFAHDEGHGPKISDSPKQGGVVSGVIESKDASKGAQATLVHKGELARSDDGTVRLYLYDKQMSPLDVTGFSQEAKGVVEFKKKKTKKWTKVPFTLKLEEGVFVGKAPQAESKPFNIDVKVNDGKRELLTAFDNLD